jgi:hypothetical protein
MKHHLLALTYLTALGGCASPEFQPYVGPAVRKGAGGTIQMVRGMEVWDGTPPRAYQILGAIEEQGGSRATKKTVLEDIVPVARAHGADALIFVEANRSFAGVDLQWGSMISKPSVKVVAIKYL